MFIISIQIDLSPSPFFFNLPSFFFLLSSCILASLFKTKVKKYLFGINILTFLYH